MTFAPVYPHGSIEPIAEDTFMVRGSIKMNALTRISRNMAIVRQGDTLTLVNPIRLNKKGLSALDALGEVKHVMRLGAFHGLDDPFYMDRYDAQFWVQDGGTSYPEPKPDQILTEGGVLPFEGGTILNIEGTQQPECLLHLARGNGVLVSCDAIQNYGNYSYNNWFARLVMPFLGFKKTTLVGPIWLRFMVEDAATLRPQFERVLELDFDSFLSAHGTFLASGAKAGVKAAIEKAFAET